MQSCVKITAMCVRELQNSPGFFKTVRHFLNLLQQITIIVPEQINGLHHWSITSGHHNCDALLSRQACGFFAFRKYYRSRLSKALPYSDLLKTHVEAKSQAIKSMFIISSLKGSETEPGEIKSFTCRLLARSRWFCGGIPSIQLYFKSSII